MAANEGEGSVPPPPQDDDAASATAAAMGITAAEAEASVISSEDLVAVKAHIISDIEVRLARKEESLWKRGQVEIKRLQLEQEQVKGAMEKLQERQVAMVSENQKLRGALVEMTAKFEMVVTEMREVLRALPQAASGRSQLSPVTSLASTIASEVNQSLSGIRCDEHLGSKPTPNGFNDSGLCISSVSMEHDSTMTTDALCTPPRVGVHQPSDSMESAEASSCVPSATSASAVATPGSTVLSLASALQSPAPSQSPGFKQLQLAGCLEQGQDANNAIAGSATNGVSLPSTPERSCSLDSSSNSSSPVVPEMAAEAVPPPPYEELFSVKVFKEPGFVTLGIDVNEEDACLMVEGIDDNGLVARHNQKQESDPQRLLVGDRIVEVNGIRQDPARILNECKAKRHLVFTVARYIPGGAPACAPPPEPSNQLRPEAEVFVPSSAQTSATTPTAQSLLAMPPGLEHGETLDVLTLLLTGRAPAVASPGSMQHSSLLSSWPLGAANGLACGSSSQEVKRMLFK